jgi:hypothetical protein
MNAAHTPTPRTDTAWQWAHNTHPWDEVVSATLSRQLERELAEAQDQIDDLTATGIHSCGSECKRPNCVLRRELAELRSKYRDHYEEAERLTREITDSRRSVKYNQDLITTLRCEKDEVIDQRDALAVVLRELMFNCLRFRIEPSDDAYKNAESCLATLEGRGSNPAQKSPPTTP